MKKTLPCVVTLATGLSPLFACALPAQNDADAMHLLTTPSGTRFGFFGDKPGAPAPTLFVFATAVEDMDKNRIYTTTGRHLAEHGWLYVTLDPPSHGRDQRDGEPKTLAGWAHRVKDGKDLMGPFVKRCRDVLDHLVARGYTDPRRVAAVGTSRGGFCALHFAAAEPRVRAVAAVSPVTHLLALREFAGVAEEQVRAINIAQLSEKLANRAVWIGIGADDARVSTDECIAAARKLMSHSPNVELVVRASKGHAAIPNAYGLAAEFLRAHVEVPSPRSVPRSPRTLLLVDDHPILYRSGVERVLHQPTRHAQNPLVPETKPWELAIGYCSVYRDPESGEYQLWYQSYAGGRAKDPTRRVVLCYAESEDGVRWRKPNLGLYNFNEIRDTNIVLVGNGGRSVNYGASVHVAAASGSADASKRYKLAYWDFSRHGDKWLPGLSVAFAPDGIRWTKHPVAPLLPAAYGVPSQPPFATQLNGAPSHRPAISDVIDLMYDARRRAYVIYAKTWIDSPEGKRFWKRAVVRTESSDFVRWSKPQLVMSPAEDDPGQLHGAPVFLHHGVYFALVQRLDFGGHDAGGTGNMPGELAVSRDGIRWERPFPSQMFLPVTGDGKSFDAGCLWTNSTPVFLDDEIRFYYGAYPGWNSDLGKEATGIGMASLRRDRFVGVRPTEHLGQVTLKPVPKPRQLTLNADAAGGAVRVEVLTAAGYRIAGFTKDEALPIAGDSTKHAVRWKEKSVADLKPGAYQFRLHLENAEVFALTFSP